MLKKLQCAELPHACPYAAHPVHTTVNVVPHAGSTASTHKRAAEIIAFCDRARGEKQQSWYVNVLWRRLRNMKVRAVSQQTPGNPPQCS